MRPVVLPEISYAATAVRPDWDDLPPTVRAAIERRLGAPVASATSAGGGFTRAFAAVVRTTAGRGAFLKAAPQPVADWYAREAAITAALPAGVPAPRPRWSLVEDGYLVLCLDVVDGHMPALPWSPDELDAALSAWRTAATTLADPPEALLQIGLPALPDLIRHDLSWWSRIEAGQEPMPPAPAWVPGRLAELAALERNLPDLVAGPGVLHGDLRLDNIMIDRAGAAWLCDWTWPCLGAPWFDAVTLLVTAYASGLDVDRRLAAWDAPPDGVAGALAALSGYWLVRAASPSSASPHSRQHQRFSGEQALAWLADRRFGGANRGW
jgi:aminoglycoside phosphotransferase (APT) family kinase protein